MTVWENQDSSKSRVATRNLPWAGTSAALAAETSSTTPSPVRIAVNPAARNKVETILTLLVFSYVAAGIMLSSI
jgi:hypothetical protein